MSQQKKPEKKRNTKQQKEKNSLRSIATEGSGRKKEETLVTK
jgi:hypothetical protein